jgi:hypothetical protein
MGRNLGAALISAAFVICSTYSSGFSAIAQETATKRIPAKLTCGSHSANPSQNKAFQVDLQFDVTGSLWLLDWNTERAQVKFRGILSPSGTMLIAGLGKSDEGVAWTYEFSGHKNVSGIAVLKGSLQSEQPKGTRQCSLTFQN